MRNMPPKEIVGELYQLSKKTRNKAGIEKGEKVKRNLGIGRRFSIKGKIRTDMSRLPI